MIIEQPLISKQGRAISNGDYNISIQELPLTSNVQWRYQFNLKEKSISSKQGQALYNGDKSGILYKNYH